MTDKKKHNEIIEAAKAAKHHRDNASAPEPAERKHWEAAAIGVGVGVIGSAAVAAAMLYANRGKNKK